MANRELSSKQRAAIRALIGGANHTQAAEAARCHPNRLAEWMREAAFVGSLHQAEAEALESVSRGLLSLANKARAALESVLDNPLARNTEQLRAADITLARLLQVRELATLENRIADLEAAQHESRT